ncbi:hypothetical protein ACB092_09G208900 [Castanea dentata]
MPLEPNTQASATTTVFQGHVCSIQPQLYPNSKPFDLKQQY